MDDDSGPTIEPATLGDVESIAELWVALARGQRAYGSHLVPERNRAAIADTISRHVAMDSLQVARDRSGIVGFVMYTLESKPFDQDVTRGLITNLYVQPGQRTEGIGSRLLAAAEQALETTGADVVTLEAMADNETAREFYRNRGYEPHRVTFEKRVESDTHSKGPR